MYIPNKNTYQNAKVSRDNFVDPNDKNKWIAPKIKYRHINDL